MLVSVRVRTFVFAVLALLLLQSKAYAANICVTGATPSGGCGSTFSTIQLAVNGASEGDTVYLHAGTAYVEAVTLPDKGMTGAGIVITGDTAAANLPAAGFRATLAHTAFMPTWTSPTVNVAAVQTAFAATSAAERYTLRGIWFTSLPRGDGDLVQLGTNNCTVSSCQEFASQQADRMTIDRCVFTANSITGQKRFVTLAGTNMSVTNSSFYGGAAFGQDGQAAWIINGVGPYTITNNHMESTGETIMSGGDDSRIRTIMTVASSPAPTTTSATVAVSVGSITSAAHTLAEVAVGDHLAILISGGTVRCHTILRSKSTSTASGAITFDACAAAPDSPGDIRAGVTPTGLSIRRNHFVKPLSWLNPIVSAPTAVSATASITSGSLAAGTYQYTVVALNTGGYQNQTVYSAPQVVTATLASTGRVVLTLNRSPNATAYRAYGRTSAGVTQYFQVADSACNITAVSVANPTTVTCSSAHGFTSAQSVNISGSASTPTIDGDRVVTVTDATHFTIPVNVTITGTTGTALPAIVDTGAAGTSATAVPAASYWQIKNHLEIKAAANVQVDSNVFDYSWNGADNGGAIWIKSNSNSSGASEFYWSRNIAVERNLFRHTNGMVVTSGSEGGNYTPDNAPGLLTNVTVRNNLLFDSGAAWAQKNGGTLGTSIYAVALNNGHDTFLLDHNTLIHTSRGFVSLDNASGYKAYKSTTVRNNLAIRNSFGILGCQTSEGGQCANGSDPLTITSNVIAGCSLSIYPNNYCPTLTDFQAEFVNYSADGTANANGPADYHLLSTSPYHNVATDGTDLGANIDTLNTAIQGVEAGSAEGTAPAPSITTTSLPNATVSSAYTATIQASGTGTITFAVISGALPTGLSLASNGNITGTPTTAATNSFTVQATDGTTALTAQLALSITVNAALTNVSITSSSPLTPAVLGQVYSFTLATSGGRTPFSWAVTSGSLPAGLTLNALTGAVSGTPTSTGSASFTVTASGAIGTPGSKAFALTVADETMPSGRVRRYNTFFEAATFLRTTCPVDGTVRKGDICSDVSASSARLRQAVTVTPSVSWQDVGATAASHNLLSATHSDTFVETAADGDMLVYGGGFWRRIPLGPAGYVLGSDGTSVGWVAATSGGGTVATTSTTYVFHTRVASSTVWTNMEAATLEFVGTAASPSVGHRVLANLVGKTTARLYARVSAVGATGSKIWAQYSTDEVTWVDLDPAGDATVSLNPNGNKTTSAFTIDPAARQLVYLRIVGSGGDGVADPSFGQIQLEVEP